MHWLWKCLYAAACTLSLHSSVHAGGGNQPPVLMFVAQDSVYYSEYIVMRRALEAAGYDVEVRSSSNASAPAYLIPAGDTLVGQSDSLPGGSYGGFVAQFETVFGSAWQAADDPLPAIGIPVMGRIQDVPDLSGHAALVIVGGTGALAYRVDGDYSALGVSSAADVQAAAEALNLLALDGLARGMPVLAQCHGASLAAFFRIPGTSGSGAEALGFSLLKGSQASGFPEPETGQDLDLLDVNYRPGDTLTVASPQPSLYAAVAPVGSGDARVITVRDWYPQNVAHAARTLINILRSFPAPELQQADVRALVLHGGAVDTSNCSPDNKENDVPCNFGISENTPVDYLDILAVLSIPSLAEEDGIDLQADELHLTPPGGALPFDPHNVESVQSFLQAYDTVLLFKHWSTGMTPQLQEALVDFVDAGGGMVALHHGLYNDVAGALNKDILVEQLFGVHSPMGTWAGSSLQQQDLLFTQAGHFVTSFHLAHRLPTSVPAAPAWWTHPLPSGSNPSGLWYQRIAIFDEIYNNWTVLPGSVFGDGVGEIEPLLATTGTPQSATHLAGFSKRLDPSGDGTIGRVIFMMAGERKESFSDASVYPRPVRNALLWTAKGQPESAPAPDSPDRIFMDGFESL